jgi:hypothetical protein
MSSRNLLHGFAMDGDQYREMYQKSIDDPAGFWSEIAGEFYWKQKWSPDEVCAENLDVTKGPIKIEVQWLFLVVEGYIQDVVGYWCLAFAVVQGGKDQHMLQCGRPPCGGWEWGQDRHVLGGE